MCQGGCQDRAAAGLCRCDPLSLAVGVSPLRGTGRSARLGVSRCAGREREGGLEKDRVRDGEGLWEGAEPTGSTGGVKLLFPLQTPAPCHPSCRSHRAVGSTCHLHTTSAAQHPRAHQYHHLLRGWPWPPLSRSLHPTTAWRVPGAAATAPSAGRSLLPPVPRTTTRLTVPGAGPGRWKTSIPSTEPPCWGLHGGGSGAECPSLLHRPRHLLLPPPATQPGRPPRSLLLLGAVAAVGSVPAGPGTNPRVGAVLGVWEAERVSAILGLAASSPSLRTKSSPRAELGSLHLLLGMTIVGWHPKLWQAPSSGQSNLACPLWGESPAWPTSFWHHRSANQLLRDSGILG